MKEAANSLWPRLSEDISGGLSRNGQGDAARAYRAADQNYAARSQNLDLINLILGDGQHSADTIANNIQRMSRSDYGQLSRSLAVLPDDQANQIRGAIVDGLGRAKPNQQDLTGEKFSLETFLTSWNGGKFSDQAKEAILPPATIRDLNDLARVASANRSLGRKGNASRSASTLNNLAEFGFLTGAKVAGGIPGLLGGAAAKLLTGRTLASPGVARALVAASENRGIGFVANRLTEAARRNPALSANIFGLRDAMSGNAPDHAATPDTQPPVPFDPADPASGPNPFDQFDAPAAANSTK